MAIFETRWPFEAQNVPESCNNCRADKVRRRHEALEEHPVLIHYVWADKGDCGIQVEDAVSWNLGDMSERCLQKAESWWYLPGLKSISPSLQNSCLCTFGFIPGFRLSPLLLAFHLIEEIT